jgi:hypothetical protein
VRLHLNLAPNESRFVVVVGGGSTETAKAH